MHDIGRFVLFDKASDELNLAQESNWESPEQLIITEKSCTDLIIQNLAHVSVKSGGHLK